VYICSIKHGNSWKRTRPFLAVGTNVSVMNCISQQFVVCVSCITCCRLAVMSHLLHLPLHRDISLAKPRRCTAHSLGKHARKAVGRQALLCSEQNRFALKFKLQGAHAKSSNTTSISSPVTWVMVISFPSFPLVVTRRFSTLS